MRGGRGYHIGRRDLLLGALATGCAPRSPQIPASDAPRTLWGVQVGDVTATSAVVWSRADRPSRLVVEIGEAGAAGDRFTPLHTVHGSEATAATDFTAKALVRGLAPGVPVRFRARMDGSEWSYGSFRPAPTTATALRFAWSGDTNGQGWGTDPARGGMPAYAALHRMQPDLFIHCGDTIYADDPIPRSIALPDGTSWNNVVDPGKTKVAETLDDYRAAHRYPRGCAEFRACSADVPLVAIWDDHEVRDNWFPGEVLADERYGERRVDVLSAHARRAMFEYLPTALRPADPMYRVLRYGPLADVFLLDGRSHRSPNEPPPAAGALLGPAQEAWLVESLATSRARWKIVACDMPIGLQIGDRGAALPWVADGWGNDEGGPPREREVELARILSALKARGVKNVVWLAADVHYAAAHRFDPVRAIYKDFDPFWELVAGPMHATAFGRKNLDLTFGPELAWCSMDWEARGSPADGRQFFGVIDVDPRDPNLQVRWFDAFGRELHRLAIPAA
ncbi:MAG: alkaline phosphatase D family protein [Labilithrix sp.]|nr:alkaline phosphatase D family protein [Labilithrix sp.]MCW5816397.1 alkaline phosphatase D family protein [Labilithrix sp.]